MLGRSLNPSGCEGSQVATPGASTTHPSCDRAPVICFALVVAPQVLFPHLNITATVV